MRSNDHIVPQLELWRRANTHSAHTHRCTHTHTAYRHTSMDAERGNGETEHRLLLANKVQMRTGQINAETERQTHPSPD